MRVRKSLVLLAAAAATVVSSAGLVGTAPVGADTTAGLGVGLTVISPDLTDLFPCQGGGTAALDSFSKFLGIGGQDTYGCNGTLYPAGGGAQNSSSFATSGVDATTGTPYSFVGTGTITGNYTYSEPCQTSPVDGSKSSLSGEAEGLLTSTVTGAGFVGTTPITDATITVGFKWSRVGFNAIIGIKGVTLSSTAGTISDPAATGVSVAVFVPSSLPDCTQQNHPDPGAINIVSLTLTA